METKKDNVIPIQDIEIAEKCFYCSDCEKEYSEEDYEKKENPNNANEFLCEDCFNDNYTYCNDCGEINHNENTSYVYDEPICESCYSDNYFYCERCDRDKHNDDYAQDRICSDCWNDEDDEENEDREPSVCRPYDKSDKYVEYGNRAFSCEIECYYPDYQILEKVASDIPYEIGISHDGSLGHKGKEFITPKLSGENGRKVLKDLCKSLLDNGFSVDRTCGLHTHLDTSDYVGDFEKIQNLILFYLSFEPVLYSFLPYSRRNNRYCSPLSQFYHEQEIVNCKSLEDLEKIWYREQSKESIESRKTDRYDSTRYAGTNLHSLLSNGHIEIRHHSGTIDHKKIINWVDLHLTILKKISNGDIHLSQLLTIKTILDLSLKQEKMFQLLNLDKEMENYFKARSKKFSKSLTDENICAE